MPRGGTLSPDHWNEAQTMLIGSIIAGLDAGTLPRIARLRLDAILLLRGPWPA